MASQDRFGGLEAKAWESFDLGPKVQDPGETQGANRSRSSWLRPEPMDAEQTTCGF